MTEDLEHLLNLLVSSIDRRNLVQPHEQIQIGRELLEVRRQLEPLPEFLLVQFVVLDAFGETTDEKRRLDTVTPDDRGDGATALLEDCREQIGRFHRLPAGPVRQLEGEVEHILRGWRDAELVF